MDIVLKIGQIAGAIVTSIGLITLIIKPIRAKFMEFIIKQSKAKETCNDIAEMKNMLKEHIEQDVKKATANQVKTEALKCLLRAEILRIYYRYLSTCEIPTYQFENLTNLYNAYRALGGNSFIKTIYEMIRDEWKKLPN